MRVTGSRRLQLSDLPHIAVPEQPAMSPDGAHVCYVLRTTDSEADANHRALWWIRDGADAVPLTSGPSDTAPAWSPDGSAIAFLRHQDGTGQVWILPADGNEPRRLTALPDGAGAPVWSPDGRWIAFAAPARRNAADAQTMAAPVVVDRLDHRRDGVGLRGDARQQLFVTEVASGSTRQVTNEDWDTDQPAWSPDGRRLAYTGPAGADADLTGASAVHVVHLNPLDSDSGRQRRVGPGAGQVTAVTWQPDGNGLLLTGTESTCVGHARLLMAPLLGDGRRELVADFDRNVMPGAPGYPGGLPQYRADGNAVLFCARDHGCTHLYSVAAAGGRATKLVGGRRVVSDLAVARAAPRAVMVVATEQTFGEVAVLDFESGQLNEVTSHTKSALPDVTFVAPQERAFKVGDGGTVPGWIIADTDVDQPAPLVVDIHGGPHNAWSPVLDSPHAYHQLLAAAGWMVLLLNIRGSDGYGEEHFTATVGAWGESDERDIHEPLNTLVAEGLADPARLAVVGYSYGGYLTCWLTGRTDRFAAAVAGGSVVDLGSMVGPSDVGYHLARCETQSLPFAQPQRAADQSPRTHVAAATTPTLLLHGAADQTCPAGQSEQWFAALRGRGVPSQLVLYPEASHLFIENGRPSHRRDYAERIISWLGRYGSSAGARKRLARRNQREHWKLRLAELCRQHGVPGAALGVCHGGSSWVAVIGAANTDTDVSVDERTLFQLGSITKVYTATALMRLVDQGRVELDTPVRRYLPELALHDSQVAESITLRHLLTHTSGIGGEFTIDTGRGDDCLARYVAALADVPHDHPLGATWSYCNAGYAIAGRVIEQVADTVWDDALRELVSEPLALEHTVTLPEQAILHRVAVGHEHTSDGGPRPVRVWMPPRSAGPAGLMVATASDVLAFAQLHLRGGVAPGGARLLSKEAVAAMQAREVDLPDPYLLGDSWGLGWCRLDWSGEQVIGHDGTTIGQAAFLRLVPGHDLAVVLLTNGGAARDLFQELLPDLVGQLADLEVPPPFTPADGGCELGSHAGTYERVGARIDVWQNGDAARLRYTDTCPVPGLPEAPWESTLAPVRSEVFAVRPPGSAGWWPVTFYALADGTPYLHLGARAARKITSRAMA